MSGSIRLSPRHGVNPSLLCCFVCGESYGVALLGQIRGRPTGKRGVYGDPIMEHDPEAPRQIRGDDLCNRCKGIVASGGVFIIEAVAPRPAHEGGGGEPTRTGRLSAIKGEAFDRIFTIPRPSKGIAYADPEAYSKIFGAPGGDPLTVNPGGDKTPSDGGNPR